MVKRVWKFEKKKLQDGLARAEGQIRSVKEKLSSAHDPAALMQQLTAARNAIDSVGRQAMLEYIKSEVRDSDDPVSKIEAYSALAKKYGW